jgi:mono/diheme cytochrome c family protein
MMTRQVRYRIAFVALVAFSATSLGCTRDLRVTQTPEDVPPEIAKLPNPETLEDSEIRYYTRQFKGKCSRCHGKDGTGGGKEAAAQRIRPTDLTDADYMRSRTDGQLFYQILMGGEAKSAMPGFGPESDYGWTEQKVWHMVAFVRRYSAGEAD